MTKPDRLDDADRACLDAILAASPELAAVTAGVRAFAAIMNEKRDRKLLEPWMTAAHAIGEPALRSFSRTLVRSSGGKLAVAPLRWRPNDLAVVC